MRDMVKILALVPVLLVVAQDGPKEHWDKCMEALETYSTRPAIKELMNDELSERVEEALVIAKEENSMVLGNAVRTLAEFQAWVAVELENADNKAKLLDDESDDLSPADLYVAVKVASACREASEEISVLMENFFESLDNFCDDMVTEMTQHEAFDEDEVDDLGNIGKSALLKMFIFTNSPQVLFRNTLWLKWGYLTEYEFQTKFALTDEEMERVKENLVFDLKKIEEEDAKRRTKWWRFVLAVVGLSLLGGVAVILLIICILPCLKCRKDALDQAALDRDADAMVQENNSENPMVIIDIELLEAQQSTQDEPEGEI